MEVVVEEEKEEEVIRGRKKNPGKASEYVDNGSQFFTLQTVALIV